MDAAGSNAWGVRPAGPEDWRAVAGLLAELGRPDVLDDRDEETHRQRFLAHLGRTDVVCLVAESQGEIAGFLAMEYRDRLHFTTPQAWIPDLVVAERLRGQGVGAMLLREAERLARQRGAWGMALESAAWRTRAHAFYLRQGWAESGKSFTRSLSDQVWPPAPPP